MRKLNLGSGEFKKKGYVNVDYIGNPDVKHNLNSFPYPFKHSEFDLIEADHLLEHLENPFKVMKEIHRILKTGGEVIIKVPHFSRGFTHPEHKRGFDVSFPLYFDKEFKGGFTGTELDLRRMRLRWFAQLYLKRKTLTGFQYVAGIVLGSIIDFLANISPYICSRFWCFYAGGFDEIVFVFRK